jgi:hypothetical protein
LSTRWNTYGECNAGACIYTSANTTPQLRGYTLGVGRERTYGDGQGDRLFCPFVCSFVFSFSSFSSGIKFTRCQ